MINSPIKIFIDYDTTLVNLIDAWIDWVNFTFGSKVTTSDITRWYYLGEEISPDANHFWRRDNHYIDKDIVKPFSGAISFFSKLQDTYGQENLIIISSTRDHHTNDKVQQMKHFFNVADEQILLTSKEKYIYTEGGVLIDDYPVHAMEHVLYNKTYGILFNENRRFGWCRPENYHLDGQLPPNLKKYDTLNSLYKDTDKEKFSICCSYDEIIDLLEKIL